MQRIHRYFVIAAILLAALVSARPASADELRLRNGDRVTGRVVSLQGGVLKFDTGHGTLDVPWADVVTATIDTPIVVTAKDRPVETVPTLSVADGQIVLGPGVTVPVGEVEMLTRPLTITGGANVGFLSTGGNTDVNSLRIDADAAVRDGRNRYTLGGVLSRAADGDVETARNATVSGRYDRFFNPRLYGNATALFTRDQFRDIDLRTALGIGVGYQLADNALLRLAVEGGYGFVDERFGLAPDTSYNAFRENVSLDVYALGKRITFFHRQDGFFGGDEDLFIQTRNGVRGGLGGGLVATIQFDLDYDRSPAEGRVHTDRAVGLTFGYRF